MELENALINETLDVTIILFGPPETEQEETWRFCKNNDNEFTSLIRRINTCTCNCNGCGNKEYLVYTRTKEYEHAVDYEGHCFAREVVGGIRYNDYESLIERIRIYTYGERVTGEIQHNCYGTTDVWATKGSLYG